MLNCIELDVKIIVQNGLLLTSNCTECVNECRGGAVGVVLGKYLLFISLLG